MLGCDSTSELALLATRTPRPTSHTTPSTTSISRTPLIDWNDVASLRRELARIDARRLLVVNAIAKLDDDGGEIVVDDSSSESGASSVFDLTQETAAPRDLDAPRGVPEPSPRGGGGGGDDDDASTVDLTQASPSPFASRRRARDEGATPQRDDGAAGDGGGGAGSGDPDDARAAIGALIKSRRDLYEPILLRQKVDVAELARACVAGGVDCDARTVKAYLDDEGVPNVQRRKRAKA